MKGSEAFLLVCGTYQLSVPRITFIIDNPAVHSQSQHSVRLQEVMCAVRRKRETKAIVERIKKKCVVMCSVQIFCFLFFSHIYQLEEKLLKLVCSRVVVWLLTLGCAVKTKLVSIERFATLLMALQRAFMQKKPCEYYVSLKYYSK